MPSAGGEIEVAPPSPCPDSAATKGVRFSWLSGNWGSRMGGFQIRTWRLPRKRRARRSMLRRPGLGSSRELLRTSASLAKDEGFGVVVRCDCRTE